jgi:hypothetical protein
MPLPRRYIKQSLRASATAAAARPPPRTGQCAVARGVVGFSSGGAEPSSGVHRAGRSLAGRPGPRGQPACKQAHQR